MCEYTFPVFYCYTKIPDLQSSGQNIHNKIILKTLLLLTNYQHLEYTRKDVYSWLTYNPIESGKVTMNEVS